MKLGTINNGTRDGALVVVKNDNLTYVPATGIANTLQQALDNWDAIAPKLQKTYTDLCNGTIKGETCGKAKFLAPLPRAYEWVDGSAYINHIVLVRKARKAEPPETLRTEPLVYQGGSGILLSHEDDLVVPDFEWGCDFESEIIVVLGDTPQGVKKADAHKYIKLIGVANDVTYRNLIPNELAKGFGFFNSKPATAFSPFFITPDELGDAWKEGRVHLPLVTKLNGKKFGDPNAGKEMHFSFFDLLEHIAKTRGFTSGTILGSGTVSNEDRTRGSSCLVEQRMIETIDQGKPSTPYLKGGDVVEITLLGKGDTAPCGMIKQKVVPAR
ncbi:MAG: fumarylacetoacetate hydrolase family protein [Oligoflexales bacterium]